MLLKTSKSTESITRPGEDKVGVGGSRRAEYNGSELDGNRIDGNKVDGGKVRDNEIEKKVQKLSKFKNLSKSKKIVRLDFFTSGAKLAFTKLRQAFIKALILHHFDLERYIQIEINISGYAIGRILSQLISNDLGQ